MSKIHNVSMKVDSSNPEMKFKFTPGFPGIPTPIGCLNSKAMKGKEGTFAKIGFVGHEGKEAVYTPTGRLMAAFERAGSPVGLEPFVKPDGSAAQVGEEGIINSKVNYIANDEGSLELIVPEGYTPPKAK